MSEVRNLSIPTLGAGLHAQVPHLQPRMENDIMTVTQEQREQFAALAKPLIQWLNKNTDPHHSIVVTPTSAELVGGVLAVQTDEFVRG